MPLNSEYCICKVLRIYQAPSYCCCCCCYCCYCYCCYCYCYCPPQKQRSKPKLSKMPIKARASNGTAPVASKTITKSKKIIKPKKTSASGKQEDQTDASDVHSSCLSLKTTESSCACCWRPGLRKTDSKQKITSRPKTQEENYSSSRGNPLRREPTAGNAMNQPHRTYTPAGVLQDRYCRCCTPKSSRHSFTGAKNHSQLDVIDEVDSDSEKTQKRNGSNESGAALGNFWRTMADTDKVRRQSSSTKKQYPPASQTNGTKLQKSLEDSCADLLNIVCENIMECVQKSVDYKFKQFIAETSDRFAGLSQELERSGEEMKHLFQSLAEGLNEQSRINLQEFDLRMQELFEKQNEKSSVETHHKECQYEDPKDEKKGSPNTHEKLPKNGQKGSTMAPEKMSKKGRSMSPEKMSKTGQKSLSSTGPSDYEQSCPDSGGNIFQCNECDCCFDDDNCCYPCPSCSDQMDECPPNPCTPTRESGGCLVVAEPQSASKRGEVKLRNTCVKAFSNPEIKISNAPCPPQNSTQLTTTNLCLTTLGQINCFSTSHRNDGDRLKMKPCWTKFANGACNSNTDIKWNSSGMHDNYDTSGYASEPEDNSEATIVSSGRKKLQKKSSAKHNSLSRQTSATNNLDAVYDELDDHYKRNSSQSMRRLSRSSLRKSSSSSTRLSRL